MIFKSASIPGVANVVTRPFQDSRGELSKVFVSSAFQSHNFSHRVAEVFWSVSPKGVLRGMHYQDDSAPQTKLVSVIQGEILDVLLDMRRDSPAFGQVIAQKIDSMSGKSVYVPHGVAHGFQVVSEFATTLYSVSSEFKEDCELGVRFDSFGFQWPDPFPTVSERDLRLPKFSDALRPL